ncbi:MAG TPA: VOC family protein [Tepidisphaeraceae bacterium]|nr:VOC family protein [Tepidisphaeraceae bacterium]
MLLKVDRVILRVPSLEAAVRYYQGTLGLKLLRQDARIASFRLCDDSELVLHNDPDLPAEATYYLVDDVRDLYRRREALKLKFATPPAPVSRGYRAAVRDPFGTMLLLLDRRAGNISSPSAVVEDAKTPGTLFAGIAQRVAVKKDVLIDAYVKIGRTADDLPYTPHFESLYSAYANHHGEPPPTRQEVWRHVLTLRKAGKLPKMGEAKSRPPAVTHESRAMLRDMLGKDIGKRDRLPYTERFDQIVNDFNATQKRRLSPHLVWRLVATLAK